MANNSFRSTRGKLTADRIVALFKSGVGTRALAAMHGTTRSSICALLRRRKVEHVRVGRFKKHDRIKGKLTAEEIVSAYTSGKSAEKIAAMDGTTVTAVIRVLKRKGCEIWPANSRIKHGFHRRAKALNIPVETYLRLKSIQALGSHCVKCGCSDIRVLQLNHLQGKLAPPNYREFMQIIQHGSLIHDVRCANCNLIYEFERGRRLYSPALLQEFRPDTAKVS